jgi:uncharacterized protein YutE (UPF0331/DUF86 family)
MLHLQASLRKLRELKEYSVEKFTSDYLVSDSALHNFQVAIGALTDIGNYLLRRKSNIIPETRGEVFTALCSIRVIDKSMEQELVRMVRFRNLIVHAYASVNLHVVYQVLQSKLSFLESLAATLIKQFKLAK